MSAGMVGREEGAALGLPPTCGAPWCFCSCSDTNQRCDACTGFRTSFIMQRWWDPEPSASAQPPPDGAGPAHYQD